MNRDEFIAQYTTFTKTALELAAIARRTGLLGLADSVDYEQAYARDIFHYGLRFAVDGNSEEIIDKILSNIIEQETTG